MHYEDFQFFGGNSRIILSHKFNFSVDSKFSVLSCHFKKIPISLLTVKFQAVSQLTVNHIQTLFRDNQITCISM